MNRIAEISRFCLVSGLLLSLSNVSADWVRFRGPNGMGVAADNQAPPTTWSDTENVKWKVPMPGPGSSGPIVLGEKIFVTYWSGYGVDAGNPGSMDNLKVHLRCVNRETGETLWDRSVKAQLPEQEYGGMFAQHGYASHTPATDGERVYAFFGKTGVYAYDLEGKELWHANVGRELDQRGWGSASSPVLTDTGLVVLASIENHSLVSLDKETGKEQWSQEAEGFGSTWGTPVVVGKGEAQEVVVGVPNEIWGLNAKTGKLRWYSEGARGNSMTSSLVAIGNTVLASGDRGGGTIVVKTGGTGDVNESHIQWSGKDGGNITSPLVYDGRIYFVKSSIVNCRDAKTGEEIYSERLPGAAPAPAGGGRGVGGGRPGGGRPGGEYTPGQGGGGGRRGGPGGAGGGRRGGGGGRFGSPDYASPVASGGYLYQLTGKGETLVVKMGDKFDLVSRNSFASDQSNFSGTPAISKGQLFLRSYQNLYCISD